VTSTTHAHSGAAVRVSPSYWSFRQQQPARLLQAAARREVHSTMVIDVSNTTFWAAVLALLIGILILIVPRILNYLVAVCLIIIGILGLIPFFSGGA
jgi:hypothetical protein